MPGEAGTAGPGQIDTTTKNRNSNTATARTTLNDHQHEPGTEACYKEKERTDNSERGTTETGHKPNFMLTQSKIHNKE